VKPPGTDTTPANGDRRARQSSFTRDLALGAAIALAYFAAAQLGFRLAFVAEQVTTVWAPTGIALGALFLGGLRLWPAVWLGAFLANAVTAAPLWTALLIATGNTLEGVVAVLILGRIRRFAFTFNRVSDILTFLLVAAIGCTAISATVGVVTLCTAGVTSWERFITLWVEWWMGDALGAVLVTPAIVATVQQRWSRREVVQAALFVTGALIVSHLIFGQVLGLRAHPLEFAIFPLVIAAAATAGLAVTALVVLSASAVAIWHTAHSVGPFAAQGVHEGLVLLQVFLGVLAATALLLGAAMTERRTSERRERSVSTMLRLAQRAGGVATFEWDVRRQVAHCSAEFFELFGLPGRDGVMTGGEWAALVHPDDAEVMTTHLTRALDGAEPATADYRIVRADGSVRWLTYAGQVQRGPEGDRMLGTVVDITDRKRLETDLRHHAAEVDRILASIGEGFVAFDREFRYLYVNDPAERMLGRARAELLGQRPWDIFKPETVRASRDRLEAAMASAVPTSYQVYIPSSGRWFENRAYPSAAGVSIFFSDVTARMAADAALRESRDVLALAMRGGSMGAWSRDLGTNEVWWSRELEEIFGLQPGGFDRTEAGFFDFIHPDDRALVRAAVDEAVMAGHDYIVEFRFKPEGGEWRWMEGRGRAVYGEDGAPRTLYGLGIDVTARKHAEIALQGAKAAAEAGQQQLAEANRELAQRVREHETLLDVLPIGIGIATDPECRHIRTNRAFAETLGLRPDSNASLTAAEDERPTNFRIFTPQGVEVAHHQLPMQTAAREGREMRDVELDVVHSDGRTVRLLEYATPLVDDQGRSRGAIGAFVDVTTAHQARVKLIRSEERYRRIFETAGVSLWEQDFTAVQDALTQLREDGVSDFDHYFTAHPEFVDRCVALVKVVDVNPATLRMFAAEDKDQLLASLSRIFRPGTRTILREVLVALATGQRHYEAEAALQALDGRHLDVVVQVAFPSPGELAERVLVSLTDITDRKQAEMALRQEVEVRTTLAGVGASLAGELRSDRLIQAVTDASTKLTDAEFGAFFYNVTDDNGDAYALYALAGAPKEAFARFPHPRATQIFGPTFRGDAIIRLDEVTADSRYGQNPPFNGMPEGHLPVRSYLAVPVLGRDGVVLGGLFFGHSQVGVFTQRHELLAAGVAGWAAIALDNARLYQEAEDANRLKDEFLATLSHELRTPLNAVLGWAHMLREGSMHPAMHQRALESVERNARAQAQLVEDLLDVSRIMAGKLHVRTDAVDLAAVVTNAVETVRAGVMAKRLDLHVNIPSDQRVVVSGDADRLQQVVWNLVSNAIKFTPAGGRVDIELARVDSKAAIIVRDTGQGIAPAFRPHLFQRFRQMDATKTRQHGGLGLGLSIVRHLVEAHGGTVAAESDGLNRGATFRVELPLRAVAVGDGDAAGVTLHARRNLSGVHALIVDDEADARDLTRYVLESRGAATVLTASAGEALLRLATEAFDILVADIGMPDQDGLALIRALRTLPGGALNRDIPAVALTAYTSVREREEAVAAGFSVHVGKPVDPEQLIAAISTLVGRVDSEA
jgi:PAS domain S-box-containing protein